MSADLRALAEALITARRQSVRPDAYFWLALDKLEVALEAPEPPATGLDVERLAEALPGQEQNLRTESGVDVVGLLCLGTRRSIAETIIENLRLAARLTGAAE